MTAPEYLDPVRHELHQLRAKIARVEALADWYESQPNWREWGVHRSILIALADKGPTP